MKLRNKKTGEVADLSIFGIELNIRKENQPIYHSLAELNSEWEDYEPKEPLIKDENIRKAIRAWAEANGLDTMPIYYDANYNRFCDDKDFNISIDFYREVEGGLHGGYSYYLDELCGEKESPEPLEPTFVDLDERIKEKAAAEKLCKGKNDMHLTEEEK